MKIKAIDVIRQLEKTAQPLPGADPPTRTSPSRMNFPSRVPQEEPQMDMQKQEEEPISDIPEEEDEGKPDDPKAIIRTLQSRYFNDDTVEAISSGLMSLIPLVPPKHAEKLADVYGKYAEAMAKLKANLASILVMMAPQQAQMQQMQNLFAPPGGEGQGQEDQYKIGPIT